MFQAVSPKTATLTTATPITWSDGSLFDGYILIGLAVPTDAGSNPWPSVNIGGGKYPPQRLPIWTAVMVQQGVIDQGTKLFWNSQIDPPGTRYAAYWLDTTRKRLNPVGEGALFDVEASPFTISVPTLTIPTTAAVAPTPEV